MSRIDSRKKEKHKNPIKTCIYSNAKLSKKSFALNFFSFIFQFFHIFLLFSFADSSIVFFCFFCFFRSFFTVRPIATDTSITYSNKSRIKRAQGDFILSPETICERFSVPLSNNTFFSPIDTSMLTENYPPKVNCILKIEGKASYIYVYPAIVLYPTIRVH